MRIFIALAALLLLIVARPVGAADTFVPNDPCTTLGASHMAFDNSGLVICGLKTGTGATSCVPGVSDCVWKAMSGGGACYTSYGHPVGPTDTTGWCLQGFANKGDLGPWGFCGDYNAIYPGIHPHFSPPAGGCFSGGDWRYSNIGEAHLCCQN